MSWLYNDNLVEDIDEKYIGFVYMITNLISGKRYIGKKLLQFSRTKVKTVTLKSGVKKKKKVKTKSESDWRTYWSSSEEVKKDVAELGEENFKREILQFCLTKGTASYYEAKYQFQYEVLEYPDLWYNGHIQCRVHRSHIKKNEE